MPLDNYSFHQSFDKDFLLDICDNDHEYLLEVFNSFLEMSRNEAAELKSLIALEDRQKLTKKVHSISSAFGFIGQTDLCYELKSIEKRVHENSCDLITELPPVILKIEQTIAIVRAEQEKLLAWDS